MFYTPKFCSECGEKIARAERRFVESIQFCDLCKTERQVMHYLTLAAMALGPILVVGYFATLFLPARQIESRGFRANPASVAKPPAEQLKVSSENKPGAAQLPINGRVGPQDVSDARAVPPEAGPVTVQKQADEKGSPIFCGLPTKKGTPCTRRVKVSGPCWQHKGLVE